MASFEHFMISSRVISFIVHLLFNVQAGVLQPAAGSLSAKSVIVTITIVRAVTSITVRAIIVVLETGLRSVCSDHRHPRLELGGVAVVWRDHHRQITNGVSSLPAIITKLKATCLPALLAPEAHVFPKFQPLPFLFRQHISPRALFRQSRPCLKSCGPTP